MKTKTQIEASALQLHDDLFGRTPNRKPYAWWRRTFDPHSESDRRAMRRILRKAVWTEGGAAMFDFLPLSDDGRRCPLGVEIYTPYGWNMLRQTADAFARGEKVWMESEAE